MPKFGLIGHPIAQSLSPALFKAAYKGKYAYDLIEGEDFEKSWRKFLEEYDAINITAPFKEEAFYQAAALARDGLGTISGPCFKIKATNLAVKTPNGIEAHNSDFTGIILSVADTYFPGLVRQCYSQFGSQAHIKIHQFIRQNLLQLFKQQPQALVIGCGGAGRAAAVAAAEMGFSTALMNRTWEKAKELAAELPEYGFIDVPVTDFQAAFKECDLVIYTLPVALPEISLMSEDDFRGEDNGSAKVVLEANYKNPAFAGQVPAVMKESGCRYISGKNWLLGQALSGYGRMCGEEPDIGAMTGAI